MPSSPPQIVFVDGPTGVGKDYFIDRFICLGQSTLAGVTMESIRATDIVLQKAPQENRKYTAYDTPAQSAADIYRGHIELLRVLKERSRPGHVLVVNRSYLSYWIYNWQTLQEFNRSANISSIEEILTRTCAQQYALDYREAIGDIPSLFVRLETAAHDHLTSAKTLIQRAKKRADGKPIDEQWFTHLIEEYRRMPADFAALFSHQEILTGEDYAVALSRYFFTPERVSLN